MTAIDYDGLVERLREGRTNGTALRWNVTLVHTESAEAIETLTRELAELEAENAGLSEMVEANANANIELVAELTEARAELADRDARLAEAEKVLTYYADTYCEGFGECVGDFCGKLSDDQCGGCPARAFLAKQEPSQ